MKSMFSTALIACEIVKASFRTYSARTCKVNWEIRDDRSNSLLQVPLGLEQWLEDRFPETYSTYQCRKKLGLRTEPRSLGDVSGACILSPETVPGSLAPIE